MWNDEGLKNHITENYIPLFKCTMSELGEVLDFGIVRGPALLIINAERQPLLVDRRVPFRNGTQGVSWFKQVPERLKTVADAEASDCVETKIKAYESVGRYDDAIKLLDARVVDATFRSAQMAAAKGDNAKAAEIYGRVVPGLIEDKDPRAIEGGMEMAMHMRRARQATQARELYETLIAAFPDDERVWDLKIQAQMCRLAEPNADFTELAKEFEKIAEEAPEDSAAGQNARRLATALAQRARNADQRRQEGDGDTGSGR
jgi:tetratricopeptide (TPR) repeat protein